MKRMESEYFEYDNVTLEVMEVLQARYPKALIAAENSWEDLRRILKFGSYDQELIAKDLFIKGFLLGRHGERL